MPRATPAPKAPTIDLRAFAGSFPSGVAVIATRGLEGTCHGITMNAVTSLSLDPPLYLICLGEQSVTLALILESRCFSINLLADHQADVSRTFASKSLDKFAATPFRLGRLDCPLLEGAVAACECCVVDVLPGGDHKIVVGRVEATHVFGGAPLVYHKGRYLQLEPVDTCQRLLVPRVRKNGAKVLSAAQAPVTVTQLERQTPPAQRKSPKRKRTQKSS